MAFYCLNAANVRPQQLQEAVVSSRTFPWVVGMAQQDAPLAFMDRSHQWRAKAPAGSRAAC